MRRAPVRGSVAGAIAELAGEGPARVQAVAVGWQVRLIDGLR